MIKSIKLINWKSYGESTLYIDPLTIVIGTNSSGKSNALDALLFLKRIAGGAGIFQSINGDVSMKALRGGIDWVCRKYNTSFYIEVLMEFEGNDYEYSIKVEVEKAKALIVDEKLIQLSRNNRLFYTTLRDQKLLNIPTYFSTGKQGKGQNFDLSRSISILYQAKSLSLKKKDTIEIVSAILSQLSGIFVLDPIPSHMRDYAPLAEELLSDGSNIAGVLAALDDTRKSDIEETITQYLKKIPEKDVEYIWTEKIGKFNTDAMLYCKEGWKNENEHIIDARGMSDGTLRFLAIVTAMLTNEPFSLLVIEEVDNGLHPSRANVLLNMLKELGEKRKIDVIITTHNPALLDAAGVSMIPFITVAHRDEEGQSILTLLEDIEDLPKLISSGNIGELTSSGKIESALLREGLK
ncbi:UNVERIFIED_CONTAM: putative ATPase [Acetivibrio alkalicellulosi]